jgi:hypothetical protein
MPTQPSCSRISLTLLEPKAVALGLETLARPKLLTQSETISTASDNEMHEQVSGLNDSGVSLKFNGLDNNLKILVKMASISILSLKYVCF